METNRELRELIIGGMNREQLIDLIRRKDGFYSAVNFAAHSDEQLRMIANSVDEKDQKKKFQNQDWN